MLFLIQIHNVKILDVQNLLGGAVSSGLVCSSLDRVAVRVKPSPDRGHYVEFLGKKTLITAQCASLHPKCIHGHPRI